MTCVCIVPSKQLLTSPWPGVVTYKDRIPSERLNQRMSWIATSLANILSDSEWRMIRLLLTSSHLADVNM